jgi:sporulation protein YlmC with PRC-barrel domain
MLDQHPSILHVSDIRELSDVGMIIDNSDKLMSPDGLVRLQQIIDFHFKLIGVKVVDERGHKLGKVKDYVIEPETYTIQQLYTEQSLLKSISTMSNVIHRSQIISVTNEHITVSSPTIRDEIRNTAKESGFTNPFRKGELPGN